MIHNHHLSFNTSELDPLQQIFQHEDRVSLTARLCHRLEHPARHGSYTSCTSIARVLVVVRGYIDTLPKR